MRYINTNIVYCHEVKTTVQHCIHNNFLFIQLFNGYISQWTVRQYDTVKLNNKWQLNNTAQFKN